jgi:predicted acylesterase/phospholipase RssA
LLLKKIKRFAGASMGAVIATSLALGANSTEIFENFVKDLSKLTSGKSRDTEKLSILLTAGRIER